MFLPFFTNWLIQWRIPRFPSALKHHLHLLLLILPSVSLHWRKHSSPIWVKLLHRCSGFNSCPLSQELQTTDHLYSAVSSISFFWFLYISIYTCLRPSHHKNLSSIPPPTTTSFLLSVAQLLRFFSKLFVVFFFLLIHSSTHRNWPLYRNYTMSKASMQLIPMDITQPSIYLTLLDTDCNSPWHQLSRISLNTLASMTASFRAALLKSIISPLILYSLPS